TKFSRDWSSDVCSSDLEKRNRRFQQRRKKAYEGSVLHFMRALAHESLKKEGFFVFTINKNPKKNSNPHKKTRLDTVRFKLIPHRSEERRVGKQCRSRCT